MILAVVLIVFIAIGITNKNKLNEYESDIYGTYATGDQLMGEATYLVFEKDKFFKYRQNDTLTEYSGEELSEKVYVADDGQGGKLYFMKGVEDGKSVV